MAQDIPPLDGKPVGGFKDYQEGDPTAALYRDVAAVRPTGSAWRKTAGGVFRIDVGAV